MHLERVKGLEAQVETEKVAKQRLAEEVGSLEASVEAEKAAVASEKEARKREEDEKAV